MFLDSSNPPQFFAILDELKFFLALGGGFWVVFTGYTWVKNNLTKDPDTLVYIIQSTYVFSDDDDEISTSKIVWHGTTNATAQEVVDYNPLKRSKTGPGRPDDTFQECKTEIEMLTWGKELVTAEDLKRIMGDLTKFSASMIRKARIAIGFTTLVTNNNEVTWVREKGQLQTNTENNG